MVHFGQRLRDHTDWEWRRNYLEYKRLKQALQQGRPSQLKRVASLLTLNGHHSHSSSSSSTSGSDTEPSSATSSALESQPLLLAQKRMSFETLLLEQYDKVERAFHRHHTHVDDQFQLVKQLHRRNAAPSAKESVKNTLVELHRMLHRLTNFALLNYSGFIKILHKYELHCPTQYQTNHRSFKRRLLACSFSQPSQLQELITRVEQMFADEFCEGDRFVAVSFLTTRKDDVIDWAPVYIGIKIGACVILVAWVVWDSVVVPTLHPVNNNHVIGLAFTPAFPVYRGVGGCLLLHWLLGVSMYVWHSSRINYRYILDLNPRTTLHYSEIFSDATNMSIVFFMNVLLYHKVVTGSFPERILPRGYYPLLLFIYAIYFYLFRSWRQQRAMLRTIFEVVGSPFFHVTFLHVLIGNYMASTVKVTQDLAWSLCFFGTAEFLVTEIEDRDQCKDNWFYVDVIVPLICALPLWWRFLQNLRRIYDSGVWWPSLPNAIKYALAHVVALFGLFHPFYKAHSEANSSRVDLFQVVWITLFAVSSFYTWVWDVWMDWGLGRPQFAFLAERQMFSKRWYYYVAIVADLFLRFAWMLTLIPPQSSQLLPLYLPPFTMVLELCRRTFWSFFWLENEHLKNADSLHVGFIPLHYSRPDEDLDDEQRSTSKPLRGQAFVAKILLIFVTVIGLSLLAVHVEN